MGLRGDVKELREEVTILKIKIDKEFMDKILDNFALFVDKLGDVNNKVETIDGRLSKLVEEITKIKIKIFEK